MTKDKHLTLQLTVRIRIFHSPSRLMMLLISVDVNVDKVIAVPSHLLLLFHCRLLFHHSFMQQCISVSTYSLAVQPQLLSVECPVQAAVQQGGSSSGVVVVY